MDNPKTVRIKASSPEQGEFVVINESDFDSKIHELFNEPVPTFLSAAKPSKRK